MKKYAAVVVSLLYVLPVHAAKPVPFAYSEWEAGTGLFYREKCPVEGATEWRHAMFVQGTGTWEGCWTKSKADKQSPETVSLCPVTTNKNGVKRMPGMCLYTEPSQVFKGNPFPEQAF